MSVYAWKRGTGLRGYLPGAWEFSIRAQPPRQKIEKKTHSDREILVDRMEDSV